MFKHLIRRIRVGLTNPEILIHGFYSETSDHWCEKRERELVDYAIKNPWVLRYNFGHLELIEKQIHRNRVI